MFNKLKMYKDIKNIQNELSKEAVFGEAENGQIKVHVNGQLQLENVEIAPELLTSENKSLIENGIKTAANDAYQKAQRIMAEKIKSSGMSMPNMQ